MAKNGRPDVPKYTSSRIEYNPDDISRKRAQNGKQAINRLPPELLSRIFAVGDEEQRNKRVQNARYYGFQDLAVQICSHWRYVAINDPSLWTYIYISRPPPHPHALLYLGRSRPSVLFTIDLEMREHYWSYYRTGSRGRDTVFRFLTSHGLTAGRWRHLIFCTEQLGCLVDVIRDIHNLRTSALRFLSLQWKTQRDFDKRHLERKYEDSSESFDRNILVSGFQMPCLCNVEFNKIPTFYLFNRPQPLLTGLTHLKLKPAARPYSLSGLHKLLSANLQLESLTLCPGTFGTIPFTPCTLRVDLSSLRSLSLDVTTGQAVVQMIESHSLKRLELICHDAQAATEIVQYITTGTINDQVAFMRAVQSGKSLGPSSVYPRLRELDVQYLSAPDAPTFRAMLSAFPTVTRVSLPPSVIHILGSAPWVLPWLECVTNLMPNRVDGLGDVLRCRAVVGLSVKRVEGLHGLAVRLRGHLPDSVDVLEHPALSDSDDERPVKKKPKEKKPWSSAILEWAFR